MEFMSEVLFGTWKSETWKHKTREQQLPAKTRRENIKKAQ